MKTIELEKTPPSFRDAARHARDEVVVFTEQGKPAFALVGVKDELALEALALRRNETFMEYLRDVSHGARQGRKYSLQDLRDELQLPAPARKPKRRKK